MSTHTKSTSNLLILFSSLLFLFACQGPQYDTFPNPALIQAANTEIRLSVLHFPSDEGTETDIVFLLENQTSNDVIFPSDFGLRLFYLPRDKNEWLEIENHILYLPEELRVLSDQKDPAHNKTVLDVRPNVDQMQLPGRLRVIVLGNIMGNNEKTAEQVSAFLDLELSP